MAPLPEKAKPTAPTPVAATATPPPMPAAAATTSSAGYGVSLSNLKKLKEEARQKLMSNQQQKEAIDINDENLQQAWLEVVEMMASDKIVYRSALLESDMLYAGHEITISATIVAMDFLKAERLRLLDFFKKKFHNEEINVLFAEKRQTAVDPSKHVPSTRELFEKMATKNPFLRQLKDSLGMDFEY